MVPIFVVLTFVAFLTIDYFVTKAQGKTHPAFTSFKVFDKKSWAFPETAFLFSNHTWLSKLNNGLVRLGVDEFITKSINQFSLSPLAKEGEEVKVGQPVMQVEFNGKTVVFNSPIKGKVSSINSVDFSDEAANPYEDKWVIAFENADNSVFSIAKSKEKAVKWLQDEFLRLKDFLNASSASDLQLAGVTMQDGGNIVEGAVANLNADAIKKFQEEFLK